VRDEHAPGRQLEQRRERRREDLAPPAPPPCVERLLGPQAQGAARGRHDGVAEGDRSVRRQPERALAADGLADGERRRARRSRRAGFEHGEAEGLLQARGAPRRPPDPAPEALRERLGAADVIGDRDEDVDGPVLGEPIERAEQGLVVGRRQQRVDEEQVLPGGEREARHLGAEASGVPLGMASCPAPQARRDLDGIRRAHRTEPIAGASAPDVPGGHSARAMILSVGLKPPDETKTEPSARTTLSSSCRRPQRSATERSGSSHRRDHHVRGVRVPAPMSARRSASL
jgi:hypothetical protein